MVILKLKINKMRKIEPVQVWKNGEQLEASLLNAIIVNDNLESACTFYYQLLTGGDGTEAMPITYGQSVAEGNISLNGEEYLEWNGRNDYAYDYIAEKLNLTLIEDS
jgi:hypothetical protein